MSPLYGPEAHEPAQELEQPPETRPASVMGRIEMLDGLRAREQLSRASAPHNLTEEGIQALGRLRLELERNTVGGLRVVTQESIHAVLDVLTELTPLIEEDCAKQREGK